MLHEKENLAHYSNRQVNGTRQEQPLQKREKLRSRVFTDHKATTEKPLRRLNETDRRNGRQPTKLTVPRKISVKAKQHGHVSTSLAASNFGPTSFPFPSKAALGAKPAGRTSTLATGVASKLTMERLARKTERPRFNRRPVSSKLLMTQARQKERATESSRAGKERLERRVAGRGTREIDTEDEKLAQREIIYDRAKERKYMLVRSLGKGGFAKCYACYEIKRSETRSQPGTSSALRRDRKELIAAKCVPKKKTHKIEKNLIKLKSEIAIHQSLNHHHVVKFLRCFEDDKYVFILLELCTKGCIQDIIKEKQPMNFLKSSFLLTQTVEGLIFLHEKSLVHRDIKPGNILLTEVKQYNVETVDADLLNGLTSVKDQALLAELEFFKIQVKLGDFGLATSLREKGRTRTLCGTPNYIAPEILERDHSHSYEVDIWALGVVLFALVFGTAPFETKNHKLTYKKIRNVDYEFPPIPFCRVTKSPTAQGQKLKALYNDIEGDHQQKLVEDLIQRILVRRPRDRLPLTEIRDHQFCTLASEVGTLLRKALPLKASVSPVKQPQSRHTKQRKPLAPILELVEEASSDDEAKLNTTFITIDPNLLLDDPALQPEAVQQDSAKKALPQEITHSAARQKHRIQRLRELPTSGKRKAAIKGYETLTEQLEEREEKHYDSKEEKTKDNSVSSVTCLTKAIASLEIEHSASVDRFEQRQEMLPNCWLVCWKNYFETTGFMFLLSGGYVGCLFKDHTEIVMHLASTTFQYHSHWFKKHTTYTLDNYDQGIRKKVRCMQQQVPAFLAYYERVKRAMKASNPVRYERVEQESRKARKEVGRVSAATRRGDYILPHVVDVYKAEKCRVFFLNHRKYQVVFHECEDLYILGSLNLVKIVDQNTNTVRVLATSEIKRDERLYAKVRYAKDMIEKMKRQRKKKLASVSA